MLTFRGIVNLLLLGTLGFGVLSCDTALKLNNLQTDDGPSGSGCLRSGSGCLPSQTTVRDNDAPVMVHAQPSDTEGVHAQASDAEEVFDHQLSLKNRKPYPSDLTVRYQGNTTYRNRMSRNRDPFNMGWGPLFMQNSEAHGKLGGGNFAAAGAASSSQLTAAGGPPRKQSRRRSRSSSRSPSRSPPRSSSRNEEPGGRYDGRVSSPRDCTSSLPSPLHGGPLRKQFPKRNGDTSSRHSLGSSRSSSRNGEPPRKPSRRRSRS
eukprot:Lankesteria_metandrocarpae@DN9835_c0_g1_i1.p1